MSKKYDGEPLDMSWQTAPWNNDGETIEVHDSNGDGKTMTIDWPENATPYDELNENQRQMIMTAARYPEVNSPQELLEKSGLDLSEHYPNYVLRQHWPERYWSDQPSNDVEPIKKKVGEIRQRLLDGESLNQLVKESDYNQQTLSKIARGEYNDLPDCQIPPLKYAQDSRQKWVKIESELDDVKTLRQRAVNGETAVGLGDEFGVSAKTIRKKLKGKGKAGKDCDSPPLKYTQANGWQWDWENENQSQDKEADFETDSVTDSVTEDTETHSVTPDPVQHTPEPESSSLPAWVWAVVGAVFAWIVSKLLG